MPDTLLQQGLDLMLFGMGTVFVFLTLLVACVSLMSRFIIRVLPESPPDTQGACVMSGNDLDPVLLEIIQDAIHQHRAKHHP